MPPRRISALRRFAHVGSLAGASPGHPGPCPFGHEPHDDSGNGPNEPWPGDRSHRSELPNHLAARDVPSPCAAQRGRWKEATPAAAPLTWGAAAVSRIKRWTRRRRYPRPLPLPSPSPIRTRKGCRWRAPGTRQQSHSRPSGRRGTARWPTPTRQRFQRRWSSCRSTSVVRCCCR